LVHGNLFLPVSVLLPNGISVAQEQLHVQFPSCGFLFPQDNSMQAPPFSSLLADHICNLMGMVPEATVISHNKITLYGFMT
jgi:hypothetical protein